MEEDKISGFDYYLSDEKIKDYKEEPYKLRLEWLYAGNLLRKGYPGEIIKIQDRFRGVELNE